MSPGCLRRHATGALIVTLIGLLAMPPTWSAGQASWAGRVFRGDGVTPRTGVVVSLLDSEGRTAVRSEPTRNDGAFVIDGAAAGEYTLAVETPEGTFVAPESMNLEPGVNRPMGLALRSAPMNAEQAYGIGDGGLSKVTKGIIAGLIGVFALFVLNEISEDEGTPPPETPF